MARHRRLCLALAAVVGALALSPPAQAASPSTIILDCQRDGRLGRTYSNEDLRRARDQLTGDQAEYTDCVEVINAAINNPGRGKRNSPRAGAAGFPGAPGGGGGGSGPRKRALTPNEQAAAANEDLAALDRAKRNARSARTPTLEELTKSGSAQGLTAADAAKAPPVWLVVLGAAAMIGLGAGIFRSLRSSSS